MKNMNKEDLLIKIKFLSIGDNINLDLILLYELELVQVYNKFYLLFNNKVFLFNKHKKKIKCCAIFEYKNEDEALESHRNLILNEFQNQELLNLKKFKLVKKLSKLKVDSYFTVDILLNTKLGLSSKGRILILSEDTYTIYDIKQVKDEYFRCLNVYYIAKHESNDFLLDKFKIFLEN